MQSQQEVFQEFFERGGSLRMLVDIPKERLEKIYAHANNLFKQKQFVEAKKFYFLLTKLDQWGFNYWLALGMSCQRLSEHEEALACFSQAGMVVVDDPRSAFYAGLSYELLGNKVNAGKAFRAAINWCADLDEYKVLQKLAQRGLARAQLSEK